MKGRLLALYLLFSSAVASAAVYQWNDAEGVTHFTDDPDTIPKSYKHKAIRRESNGKVKPPSQAPTAEIRVPAAPKSAEPAPQKYDGHSGEWWQDRFQSLRSQLKSLEEELEKQQTQMVRLKRLRVIYMRARDRAAINTLQASIDSDSARISQLRQDLQALERSADAAGVPAELRR